jgi:hypothetical protein
MGSNAVGGSINGGGSNATLDAGMGTTGAPSLGEKAPASAPTPIPTSDKPAAEAGTAASMATPAVESAPEAQRQVSSVGGNPSAPASKIHGAARQAPSSPRQAAPTAAKSLDGTVRTLSQARLAGAAAGDDLAVTRALGRAFDAALGRAPLSADVAARLQDARGSIAQKVSIANTASPADAPGLYLDAIQKAKDSLPARAAEAAATVVRSHAMRKFDISGGDLAAAAYKAAAGGLAAETKRLLTAFDKWEAVLGAPGRPLISNAAVLKDSVTSLLQRGASGAEASMPRVSLVRDGGTYTAVLPGAGVSPVHLVVSAFAGVPAAQAAVLGDAYRAYAADPRASTGAGVVYHARRALGSSVPAAAISASRFWLRAVLESLWRRIVALFRSAPAYDLSRESGRDALRRDAALAATARAEAAAARRLMSAPRLKIAAASEALDALARAARAVEELTGDGAGASAVESLRRSFVLAAGRLAPSNDLPAGAARLVAGPGGVAHWAGRLEAEESRALDGRFARGAGIAGIVNLGASSGRALSAAAEMKDLTGGSVSAAALDERLWASGRGAYGAARISAELRSTASGGSVELFVEKADAELSRRLEDMGLTVFPDGAGLRAAAGPEGFPHRGDELGAMAAYALAAALGRLPPSADDGALQGLAQEVRRNQAGSAQLAAVLLDGREALIHAPVIGFIGDYEALAPTPVGVEGRTLLVSALRDPDTGLPAYARATRLSGAALTTADLRALLRAR